VKDLFTEERNNFLPSTERRGCFYLRYILPFTFYLLPPIFYLLLSAFFFGKGLLPKILTSVFL
jgi:hypothetical protein